MQIEIVVQNPKRDGTGGRALALCPACGKRCRSLWAHPAVVIEAWEPRPEPWRVPSRLPVGLHDLPNLKLASGVRSPISWACERCHPPWGHPMRGGPATRLRYLVNRLASDPRRGQRHGRHDTLLEVADREDRLQRALKRLAEIEAAQTEVDVGNLAAALDLADTPDSGPSP